MKFNSRQANEAVCVFTLVLGFAVLIGVWGYVLYISPWPFKVVWLSLVAVPVIAGFWPTKKETPL